MLHILDSGFYYVHDFILSRALDRLHRKTRPRLLHSVHTGSRVSFTYKCPSIISSLLTTISTIDACPLSLTVSPGMTEDLFEQAIAYSTAIDAFQYSYNDGAYAELSMAKLTKDVSMESIWRER